MGRMSDEAIGLEDEGKAPWQLDPLHFCNQDEGMIPGRDDDEDDETDSTSDDVESKNSEDVTDECPF